VVLGPDDSAASAAGLGAGPQRLEMVLARSPLPVALPPIFGNEAPARPTSIEEERTNTMQSGGAAAIRGAFTLRPQTAPAGKDARPNVGQLWELWWIPLPPIQDNPDLPPLPMSAAAGVPVRLCSDLVRCSWRFFRENEWRTEYRVTGARELPAYAETDIELANGIRGKWLMEIDYSTGAEFTASGLDESDPLTRDPSGRTPDGRSPTSGTGTAGTTRARPSTGGGR
jgi:hypothetical protein